MFTEILANPHPFCFDFLLISSPEIKGLWPLLAIIGTVMPEDKVVTKINGSLCLSLFLTEYLIVNRPKTQSKRLLMGNGGSKAHILPFNYG